MIAFGAAGVFAGPREKQPPKRKYPLREAMTNEQKVLHILEEEAGTGAEMTRARIRDYLMRKKVPLKPDQIRGALARLKRDGLVRIASDCVHGPTTAWELV